MPKQRAKRSASRAEPASIAPRADLGVSADSYFKEIQPPALNQIAAKLRAIVRAAAPRASEAIKWGMPVYEHNGLLCYIIARATYISLGFYHQGIHLSDPDKLLEGTGERMRHAKIRTPADIKAGLFSNWVKHAVAINDDQ
jgi:hypothetical protein